MVLLNVDSLLHVFRLGPLEADVSPSGRQIGRTRVRAIGSAQAPLGLWAFEDRHIKIQRLMALRNLNREQASDLFDEFHRGYEELWEEGFQRKVEVEVDCDNDYKERRMYGYPAVSWRKSHGYHQTDFDFENREQA